MASEPLHVRITAPIEQRDAKTVLAASTSRLTPPLELMSHVPCDVGSTIGTAPNGQDSDGQAARVEEEIRVPSRIIESLIAGFALLASSAAVAANVDLAEICGDCRPEKIAACGGWLEGPALDATGRLWIMDVSGDRILEIKDGACISHGKTGARPAGAKFRRDGTLVITTGGAVIAFDPGSAKLSTIVDSFEGKPLDRVNDLAVDSQGGIYFTEARDSSVLKPRGRVFYLAPGTHEPRLLADTLAFPNGITIGVGDQIVFVAESAAKRIIAIPSFTAKSGIPMAYVHVATPTGAGPDGILMDQEGKLFTAQLGGGEVLVFSPESRLLGAIQLPDDKARYVTNVTLGGGYLYITEAAKGEIWRVRLR